MSRNRSTIPARCGLGEVCSRRENSYRVGKLAWLLAPTDLYKNLFGNLLFCVDTSRFRMSNEIYRAKLYKRLKNLSLFNEITKMKQ